MSDQPVNSDHEEVDLGAAAGISDVGLRHHRNEDAMALRRVPGTGSVVAVVCDGVSTSDSPDEGSRAGADAAIEVLLSGVEAGEDAAEVTRDAVTAAAGAVQALVPEARDEDEPVPAGPACTIVSAIVTGDEITVGWVGDSRAYWLAEGTGTPSRCLTADDSWAARLVAQGRLAEEEVHTHRLSHVLLAWLGAGAVRVQPHVEVLRPDGPGVLLVCSDGLWNYLPAARSLADVALPTALDRPLEAADQLTGLALEAGGHDNITAVLVPFPPGA
jgi:serine/threonine protein phosphatase PrpC